MRIGGLKSARLLGALLLTLGCTAPREPDRNGKAAALMRVAQRVTATFQRPSLRLVRLETEHETFLTTPEHPFATPGSGWTGAGQLVSGNWVTSEKFGAVRIVSIRSEATARPVPVFNLSVALSHAYFVGTDGVLVHNTKCASSPSESFEAAMARRVREREEINRELAVLTKTDPTSPRIAELKLQRKRVQNQITDSHRQQRKIRGAPTPSHDERALQHFEVENETERKALETARQELADLQRRGPRTEDEKATIAASRAELEAQVSAQQLSYDRTNQIVSLLRELVELEKSTPAATDADRRALDARKSQLRAQVTRERKRANDLKYERKRRAAPEWREGLGKLRQAGTRRRYRSASYEADTERPRDPLELLEEELALRLQEPPSESRDARLHHLSEQIETMRKLVEVRKAEHRVREKRYRAQRMQKRVLAKGENTSKLDETIEQLERELRAIRLDRTKLRVSERLLASGTPWAHAPGSVDEAKLREFQRQLAEGLENEQQLAGIERELDALGPPQAGWQASVLNETHDVDEVLLQREELLQQNPSPERDAEFESSHARLQQELREERAAVEGALSALVNEYAYVQTTQAGSSTQPSWQERLRGIQQEQERLRARWRAGLNARLDSARQTLRILRSIERFRDETAEAEVGREIALLERELLNAG